MPNLASAKKRLRQNTKKALRNQIAKTRIKTETKKVLAGEAELGTAQSVLDRAAAKGIMHRNTAARRKSRLAKQAAAKAKAVSHNKKAARQLSCGFFVCFCRDDACVVSRQGQRKRRPYLQLDYFRLWIFYLAKGVARIENQARLGSNRVRNRRFCGRSTAPRNRYRGFVPKIVK